MACPQRALYIIVMHTPAKPPRIEINFLAYTQYHGTPTRRLEKEGPSKTTRKKTSEQQTLILLRRLLTRIVRPLTSLALSVPVPCLSLSRKKSGPLLVRDSGGGVGLGCKRFDSSGAGILEKCDVWCLFVWVMTRGPRFISEILNHRTVGLRKILPDPESLDQ